MARTLGSRFLQQRQALALDTDVTIRWREQNGVGTTNPVTGNVVVPMVERTKAVKACVHFVDVAMARRVQFTSIEMGDAILDFAHDAPLDGGKEGLKFEFGGSVWEQRNVGDAPLARAWDVLIGGQRVTRTVVVRRIV